MIVKQISVFLENATGHFLDLSKSLGESGINIEALSLSENAEYGIARMIVSDVEKAAATLRESGYPVTFSDVLRVEVSDKPGALSAVLEKLGKGEGGNVSYIYGYSVGDCAYLIIKVEEPEKAEALL